MRPIVLASSSAYRKALFARLGVPFEAMAPRYEERPLRLPPEYEAVAHAIAKARSLAAERPDAIIVGSDQLVSVDGDILGKPLTEERAVEQVLRLAGREHLLVTAVSIHEPETRRTETAVDIERMKLRPIDEAEAREYVRRDRPLDCAGSYRIESLGIALMARVDGPDPTAIVGLPLIAVTTLLAFFGVRVLGAGTLHSGEPPL